MSEWDAKAKLCGNCRFWPLRDWNDRDHLGYPLGNGENNYEFSGCRRHAPTMGSVIKVITHYTEPQNMARWPEVHRESWCGDFEERKP